MQDQDGNKHKIDYSTRTNTPTNTRGYKNLSENDKNKV